MNPLTFLARHQLVASLLAVGLAGIGGFALGESRHPAPVSVAQKDTAVENESAGLDLTVHQTKTEEPKTVTRTRIVYRDGPVQERVVTRETTGQTTTTTDVGEKVQDDLHLKSTESSVTKFAPKLHAYAEVGPTLDLGSGHADIAATAGVVYYVLGPVYVGAEVIEPSLLKPVPPIVSVVAGLGL